MVVVVDDWLWNGVEESECMDVVIYLGFSYSCWIGLYIVVVVVRKIEYEEMCFLFNVVNYYYGFIEIGLCVFGWMW